MRKRYQRWMHNWEYRLTTRDTNRVVRPLDYGLDWTRNWPFADGLPAGASGNGVPPAECFLRELNQRILADSDKFFAYETPRDFCLERDQQAQWLRFTSAVETRYACNNLVNARWFPARGRRAMVVMPQWNADADSHNGLCRIFQFLGIASLRLSMPYHDTRKPAETERSDYAVSSNLARTIDAARQAIIDVRSCLDWLESRGYRELGVLGTSLGSCYAFIASAHDPRLKLNVFNHASTYFADVVWTGQSTRHIRAGLEKDITLDRLRPLWHAISPICHFERFARWPKRSLIVYASYDLTFLPQFSRQVVEQFQQRGLDHRTAILPCGHYTTGETPYKYLDAWHIARFVSAAF
ncbi:MAG: RcgR family putative quorum lactone hydrolase [Terriglobales bacterium]